MANTTFASNVRSNGGDNKRETYCGGMMMMAQFYFDPTDAAGTDVQVSATDTREVVLPTNTVVLGISFNGDATGGTNPTIDMGYTDYDGGTNFVNTDGYLDAADADAGAVVTVWGGDSTAGVDLADVGVPATEKIKVVGGHGGSAAAGGTITGIIYYYVKDDGKEST